MYTLRLNSSDQACSDSQVGMQCSAGCAISGSGHQPALHSAFWQSTEHELCSAAGYGLDYIWPWLAGFPQDRIAIVDDLCVFRPAKPLNMDTKPIKVSTKDLARYAASYPGSHEPC